MSELILYTGEEGASRIPLCADDQTVWLTQAEMAELSDATTGNFHLHLTSTSPSNALVPERTDEESSVVRPGSASLPRLRG